MRSQFSHPWCYITTSWLRSCKSRCVVRSLDSLWNIRKTQILQLRILQSLVVSTSRHRSLCWCERRARFKTFLSSTDDTLNASIPSIRRAVIFITHNAVSTNKTPQCFHRCQQICWPMLGSVGCIGDFQNRSLSPVHTRCVF